MYLYILVKSLTSAQRAERCLFSAGVNASIIRLNAGGPGMGCGYTVRIWEGDRRRASDALRACGIRAAVKSQQEIEEGCRDRISR